jgi:hypothetical protein
VNREKQSLIIKQLEKSLEGNYTCIVQNTHGAIMHSFRYSIVQIPMRPSCTASCIVQFRILGPSCTASGTA